MESEGNWCKSEMRLLTRFGVDVDVLVSLGHEVES
jgi:hypothetical protein